jgi:homoserine trans-succinylase
MDIVIRIKTGFFEKTPYRLAFEKDELRLAPVGSDGVETIILDKKDIRSVTLTERGSLELEIQTRAERYFGVLEDGCPMYAAVNYFKEHLNVNITCEYKGGDKNA